MRALISILLLTVAVPSQAATWRVEKDGSGDFTVIQDAIDASAPGDSIVIGPGRYDDFFVYTFVGGGPQQTIGVVTQGPLTVRGSSSEEVLIGPPYLREELGGMRTGSFAVDLADGRVVLEDLTFEHTYFIVTASSVITMQRCVVQEGELGLSLVSTLGTIVQDCRFEGENDVGIQSFLGGDSNRDLLIRDCMFLNDDGGVNLGGALNARVERSVFSNTDVGLVFWGGSTGEATQNTFLGGRPCMSIRESDIVVTDSVFGDTSRVCMRIDNGGRVTGTNNALGAATFRTVEVIGPGSYATLTGGSILNGGGLSVYVSNTTDVGLGNIDMTNNYWGTTSADQISEWILDANDSELAGLAVDFIPFRTSPIATESKSFSDLKALFSGKQ
jgi:hypothetical protein